MSGHPALYVIAHGMPWPDDPNPRNLPVFHPTGACPNPDNCRPLLEATCAGCRDIFNLCGAERPEIEALMSQEWLCGGCR